MGTALPAGEPIGDRGDYAEGKQIEVPIGEGFVFLRDWVEMMGGGDRVGRSWVMVMGVGFRFGAFSSFTRSRFAGR